MAGNYAAEDTTRQLRKRGFSGTTKGKKTSSARTLKKSAAVTPPKRESVIDRARALLAAGRAAESWALLEQEQDANINDAEFNYLMGISAIDAKKPGEAVFALERALAIDPNYALARAELGRAMLMMGELSGARGELEQVRSTNPPPEAARVIDQAISEIDRIEKAASQAGKSILTAYIEGEVGYDTNINTAPDASSILIPAFSLPMSLVGFAKSQESSFIGLNGGAAWYKPLREDLGVFASLDLKSRYHFQQQDFAPASLYGTAGARVTRGVDQFSFGLTQYTYYIGQYHNDDQTGGFVQWQREFSGQDIGGAFAQYTRVDHPEARYLDTDLFLAGGFWTHAFMAKGDPLLSLVAYAGNDRQLGNNDPWDGRVLYGGRGTLEYKLGDRYKLFGGLGVAYSRYNAANPFYGITREDTRYDVNLGLAYKVNKLWTVTPQLSYTKNDSTLSIDEWDRAQAYVTVRRDFF